MAKNDSDCGSQMAKNDLMSKWRTCHIFKNNKQKNYRWEKCGWEKNNTL
jgi:hypothetical protein